MQHEILEKFKAGFTTGLVNNILQASSCQGTQLVLRRIKED